MHGWGSWQLVNGTALPCDHRTTPQQPHLFDQHLNRLSFHGLFSVRLQPPHWGQVNWVSLVDVED